MALDSSARRPRRPARLRRGAASARRGRAPRGDHQAAARHRVPGDGRPRQPARTPRTGATSGSWAATLSGVPSRRWTAVDAEPGDVDGLLLFASYPAGDMSDFGGLRAVDLRLARRALDAREDRRVASEPSPTSTFTVVDGAVHAQFGSYGPQPGRRDADYLERRRRKVPDLRGEPRVPRIAGLAELVSTRS